MGGLKKQKARARLVRPDGQPSAAPSAPFFAEAPAWKSIGPGWRPLFSSYHDLGLSFEWHEFTALKEFDWSRTFHPNSIELCLNLEGEGKLADKTLTVEVHPQ